MSGDSSLSYLEGRLTHVTFVALMHRNLRLTCRACGHSEVLNAAALWWRFEQRHWDDRLAEMGKHLLCTECLKHHGRQQRHPAWEITDADETRALPMPDARAWRRLVSRYRS